MPTYEVTERRFFKEKGQTILPPGTVELTEAEANEINRNEGRVVVKPVRMTTQASPEVISAAETAVAPARRGRKPRGK